MCNKSNIIRVHYLIIFVGLVVKKYIVHNITYFVETYTKFVQGVNNLMKLSFFSFLNVIIFPRNFNLDIKSTNNSTENRNS